MSKKKVSYINLLKEAIAEFDTSDTVDVKGPMLDPILSWDGGGEIPTNKDAASVLERYYFNQDTDKGVDVMESDYENDKGEHGKGMENTEGPGGEEQAGTAKASNIPGAKKEKEKDIAKEALDDFDAALAKLEEAEGSENDFGGGDVDDAISDKKDYEKGVKEQDEMEDEEDAEDEEVTEDLEMENAIIEKLISEMEDEEDEEDKEEEKEEVEEAAFGNTTEAPPEKKAKTAMDDSQGAGTQQAGTGDAEGEVPSRKDVHDQMVKPKNYTSEDADVVDQIDKLIAEMEEEMPEGDEEGGEEEELDVDKEMEESFPLKDIAQQRKGFDDGYVEEAFTLFEEAIKDEDEEDDDDDDDDEKEEKEEK